MKLPCPTVRVAKPQPKPVEAASMDITPVKPKSIEKSAEEGSMTVEKPAIPAAPVKPESIEVEKSAEEASVTAEKPTIPASPRCHEESWDGWHCWVCNTTVLVSTCDLKEIADIADAGSTASTCADEEDEAGDDAAETQVVVDHGVDVTNIAPVSTVATTQTLPPKSATSKPFLKPFKVAVPTPKQNKPSGKVKVFFADRGYGFIAMDDSTDLFFRADVLENCGHVLQNAIVECDVAKTRDGKAHATKVTVLKMAPVVRR